MTTSDPIIAASRQGFEAARREAVAATDRASRVRGDIPGLLATLDECEAWQAAGDAARRLRAAYDRMRQVEPRFDELGDGSEEDGR